MAAAATWAWVREARVGLIAVPDNMFCYATEMVSANRHTLWLWLCVI